MLGLKQRVKLLRQFLGAATSTVKLKGGIKPVFVKVLRIYREEGLEGVKYRLRVISLSQTVAGNHERSPVHLKTINRPAEELPVLRVLIIAEMSIAQCKKYRVFQKQEMFKILGIDCTVIDWTDTEACIDSLQTHSLVMFYRVPAYPNVLVVIEEAKRLRLPTMYDVDDLIFDKEVLGRSRELKLLDKHTYNSLLEGADLYRKAMVLCDKGIASTRKLAEAMINAGMDEASVLENALDAQTLEIAQALRNKYYGRKDEAVRIVYGSGTNTHNIDFLEASKALVYVLRKFPHVKLRIIGTLSLPKELLQFKNRIESYPSCNYREYMEKLAQCDISIAPLEDFIFNECKSNIKYLEASILKLPSVCSPRSAFCEVIRHGENGFLCESQKDWETALSLLIENGEERKRIGEAAYETVIKRYCASDIAYRQLEPLVKHHRGESTALRVLSVNRFYSPWSFGGATIIAEEMNKRLNEREDIDVHVFTAVDCSIAEPYKIRRWESDGVNVYGVGLPGIVGDEENFENSKMSSPFEEVLATVKPDIVHFHCIQDIGVSVVDACIRKGIKYIITLHDAWWLCMRQFMINRYGKYCNQKRIDLELCSACTKKKKLVLYRAQRLRNALKNASLLLVPSHFFAGLYAANGFTNVRVNKNGVQAPKTRKRIRKKRPLTFGYVGGRTEIKGFHLVKKVFSELHEYDIKLILVDNTMNLGYQTYNREDISTMGNVEVIPAYTQKTIEGFFEQIDVLLFPTQWKESFGLTVREALIRNVWVIATDAGGVIEDIEPGKNGYIIPLSDEGQALKEAVIQTIKHFEHIKPGEVICLGTENITTFEEQASELEAILRQVGIANSAGIEKRALG